MIVKLCNALLTKINIAESDEQLLTNDLALALSFVWKKCCQGENKGVDAETHKFFRRTRSRITEIVVELGQVSRPVCASWPCG
jgi:hypothetical protein